MGFDVWPDSGIPNWRLKGSLDSRNLLEDGGGGGTALSTLLPISLKFLKSEKL